MTQSFFVNQLVREVRGIYDADPVAAARTIEDLIKERLSGRTAEEGREILEQLVRRFSDSPKKSGSASVDSQTMTRVFSILLGCKVEPDDISSSELLERLAQSLNTIFDALNRLISMINASFTSADENGEQTIRQFIGVHLESGDHTKSLEDYLGQINQAFLMTHEAFKKAARTKMEQVLRAIDLSRIADKRGPGFKIGPLRKAEDYDILAEKIKRIRHWFDSGRFMEDFLREFESNCQVISRKDRG